MIQKLRLAIRNELEAPAEKRQFGSGWLSGTSAIVLSIACFLLLLSQKFPQWFSMADLNSLHANPWFSFGIKIGILISFLLACLNLVLRQNKILGFSSIIIALLTTTLGEMQFNSGTSTAVTTLGIDWFVLNIFLTGIIFVPLEKLFGRLPFQPLFRTEWREDLFYFLLSSVLVQSLMFLSLAPANAILHNTNSFEAFRKIVAEQHFILQVIEIMFLTDFVQYWFHRAFHEIPFLWNFHAVHHSAQKMDWIAGSRMHIFEIIGLRSMTVIPMFVLGFTQNALHAYIFIVYLNATYLHTNVRFNIEWLKSIIATPRFHHWHHGIEKEAININYSIHFPLIDKMFGTYYMPPNQWPSGYGINDQIPNGYWGQFIYPLKPK
jgi:sterol desaturase/sphingolipid hydroxylase (fatty acid hydroxylase superfamily)